ncbi:hypothetical protein JYQ62_31535 [Nostoc sp. UHCC 0702]|nr:hypothetical protein JYQ62_31535 [Nostoc sp. UHCC 0702]
MIYRLHCPIKRAVADGEMGRWGMGGWGAGEMGDEGMGSRGDRGMRG